jgi:hypothetical protein
MPAVELMNPNGLDTVLEWLGVVQHTWIIYGYPKSPKRIRID